MFKSFRARVGWPGVAVLVFLFSYLFFLLASWPVANLWAFLEPRLAGDAAIEVQDLSGSVWAGQVGALTVGTQELGSLAWRWRPSALLRAGFGLQVNWSVANTVIQGHVLLRPGHGSVRHVRGQVSAAWLQQEWDLPVLLAGDMDLDLKHLVWDPQQGLVAADGVVGWNQAGAGLPQPLALGDLQATLAIAEPGTLQLDLSSAPDAPLALSGTVFWRPTHDYRAALNLRAEDHAAPGLRAALSQIGQNAGDGSRQWSMQSPGWQ